MSVRVLYDRDERAACLYDDAEGVAFGPVIHEAALPDGWTIGADEAAALFSEWTDINGIDPAQTDQADVARWIADEIAAEAEEVAG